MARFNPEETNLPKREIIKDGTECLGKVTYAEDKNYDGKDSIALTIEAKTPEGKLTSFKFNLNFTNQFKGFCSATELMSEFNAGLLPAATCLNKKFSFIAGVKSFTGKEGNQIEINTVKKFMPLTNKQPSGSTIDTSLNDDVPW